MVSIPVHLCIFLNIIFVMLAAVMEIRLGTANTPYCIISENITLVSLVLDIREVKMITDHPHTKLEIPRNICDNVSLIYSYLIQIFPY